jgi:hypothetical protein
MAKKPLSTQPTPQLIPNIIADDCPENPHHNDGIELQKSLLGEKAGREHQAFSRNQNAEKRRALQRGSDEDDEITPVSQSGDQVQDVMEQRDLLRLEPYRSKTTRSGGRAPSAPESGTQECSNESEHGVHPEKNEPKRPEGAAGWISEYTSEDDEQLARKGSECHARPVLGDEEATEKPGG